MSLFWTLALLVAFVVIYAKFFRARVFAFLLNCFSKQMGKNLHPVKVKLFEQAFQGVYQPGKRLKILEIGVGTGVNFKYYPRDSEITILDKSDAFLSYLKESIKKDGREDLTITDLVINHAEDMHSIEANTFDAVIGTLTICSFEKPKKVFQEVKRILKPGGVYLFLDHSMDMKNPYVRFVQKLVTPIWGFIFDDCKFVDIKRLVEEESGFEKINIFEQKSAQKGLLFKIVNPTFYGFCFK